MPITHKAEFKLGDKERTLQVGQGKNAEGDFIYVKGVIAIFASLDEAKEGIEGINPEITDVKISEIG